VPTEGTSSNMQREEEFAEANTARHAFDPAGNEAATDQEVKGVGRLAVTATVPIRLKSEWSFTRPLLPAKPGSRREVWCSFVHDSTRREFTYHNRLFFGRPSNTEEGRW
jgi:hypothetical protein